MTPAINLAKKHKMKYTVHEYTHDTSVQSYGLEASQKLGVEEKRVFKTLVVSLSDDTLAVGVIPVCDMLNMKQIAKALKTVMDSSAQEFKTIFISGGKRGLDIEISPLDLQKLTKASFENLTIL